MKTALSPGLQRGLRIAAATLGILTILLALAVVAVLSVDWNRARPWLNAKTSEAIGRPFSIAGDLVLQWDAPLGGENNWHDFVPWPHLHAYDVRIGNPANMEQAAMATVKQFSFALNPFALLDKRISIPELRFESPHINLQRLPDGRNNWTFQHEDKPSPWTLHLETLVFTQGQVNLQDAIRKADIHAELESLIKDPEFGVRWSASGQFEGEELNGHGKAGAVLSLQHQSTPYPITVDLRVGSTRIIADGSLTKPSELAALDLRLSLSGASMARLFPLIHVVLPETPPFSTSGRLKGQLSKSSSIWTYEQFKGKVGASDIGGSLRYQSRLPRGILSGEVVSQTLRMSDLAPVIGADSNAKKETRGAAPVQPKGKVLPVETFKTERWTSVDADVKFSAAHILRDNAMPVTQLSTHLFLNDGVLRLAPLDFTIASGNLHSIIKLDGSKSPMQAESTLSARHLRIKQLFPTLEASIGEINGDARLNGSGNSIASMLASANGEASALVNQGKISKLLLEEMGLNIGSVVLTKLLGDRQINLNCMASDFAVQKGVMQVREFIVDTDDAIVDVDGHIDLAREELDLTIHPNAKGIRIISLRTPLYVRGPFAKPDVSLDKGVLAMRAGGALALATLAPLAAILPLVNASPGQQSDCAAVLRDASGKKRKQ